MRWRPDRLVTTSCGVNSLRICWDSTFTIPCVDPDGEKGCRPGSSTFMRLSYPSCPKRSTAQPFPTGCCRKFCSVPMLSMAFGSMAY